MSTRQTLAFLAVLILVGGAAQAGHRWAQALFLILGLVYAALVFADVAAYLKERM